MTVAGKTMEKNFTVLGPYVLPITEQLKVGYSIVKKMGCKYLRKTFGDKSAIGNCVPECVAPSIYIYTYAPRQRGRLWCPTAHHQRRTRPLDRRRRIRPADASA